MSTVLIPRLKTPDATLGISPNVSISVQILLPTSIVQILSCALPPPHHPK